MIGPMIRHRIVIRLLMHLHLLFICIRLVTFLVMWRSHINAFVHRITIRIVIVRRHSFVALRIVFVMFSILVVGSFVGLVVLLWSEWLVFMWIVRCMHGHGRIVIWVALHAWV